MATVQTVFSYHVNVMAGDAAIHLLVNDRGARFTAGRYIIVSAVLIDGGDTIYMAHKNTLLDTIVLIQNDLSFDFSQLGTSRTLLFESIVITHWHGDHYRGFLRLMRKCWTPTARQSPIPFFKYGPLNPTTGNFTPQTTLYAPNLECVKVWSKKKDPSGLGKKYFQTVAVLGIPAELQPYAPGPDGNTGLLSYSPTRLGPWTSGILRYQVGDLRGIDFFTGNVATVDPHNRWDSVIGPAALMADDPLFTPRLYCVASASLVMGRADPIPTAPNNMLGDPDIINSVVRDQTNHNCIVAMVMWRTTLEPVQVSLQHYLAADCDWTIEDAVRGWAKGPVAAMKLSHHGSATSTSTRLMQSFQPTRIIVSAGFSYGHPVYELLLWLSAFYSADGRMVRPFYPTNFPYYFTAGSESIDFLPYRKNGESLWKGSPLTAFGMYRTQLQAVFNAIGFNSPAQDLLTYEDFVEAGDDVAKKSAAARKFASMICFQFWRILSPLRLSKRPGSWPNYCTERQVDSPMPGQPSFLFHRVAMAPNSLGILSQMQVPIETGSTQDKTKLFSLQEDDRYPIVKTKPVAVGQRVRPFANVPWPSFGRIMDEAVSIVIPRSAAADDSPFNDQGDDDSGPGPDASQGDSGFANDLGLASLRVAEPLEGLAVAQRVHPLEGHDELTISNGDYYFWSGVLASSPPTPGSQITTPSLDLIIAALQTAQISLASQPSSTGIAFAADDDMNLWFSQAFTSGSLTAFGDSTVLDQISLEMSFANGTLQYNSAYFCVAMGLQSTPIAPSVTEPMQGVVDPSIILGLSASTFSKGENPPALSFSDLMKELYRENSDQIPLGAVLFDELQLEMDSTEGSRNAVWFSPSSHYETIQRLQFNVTSPFPDLLAQILHIKVPENAMSVIAKKEFCYYPTSDGTSTMAASRTISRSVAILGSSVSIAQGPSNLSFALSFQDVNYAMMIRYDGTDRLDPGFLIDWLGEIITDGFAPPVFSDLLRSSAIPGFRRVSVQVDSVQHHVQEVELDLDWQLNFGSGANDKVVTVLLTYRWSRGGGTDTSYNSLRAALWYPTQPLGNLPAGVTPAMLPAYEAYQSLQPIDQFAATDMSLEYLLPSASGLPSMPACIADARVTSASIEIDSSTFQFEGGISFSGAQLEMQKNRILKAMQDSGSTVPSISFDTLYLSALYSFKSDSGGEGNVDLALNFTMALNPSAQQALEGYPTGYLTGSIEYNDTPGDPNSSTWQITASATGISMATLYSFFDSDIRDGVMSVLKTIFIQSLDLNYVYASGAGSSFTFTGLINLDILTLSFTYDYYKNKEGQFTWDLTAQLTDNAPASNPKLYTILSCLSDFDIKIPDAVGNIEIDANEAILTLKLKKSYNKNNQPIVFSVVELEIKEFALSFVQFVDPTQPDNVTKLVIASLSKLPGAEIPIVGSLEQPFDELYFLYLDATAGGLTAEEVDMFNSNVDKTFLVQQPPKKGSNFVVEGKYHFTVIVNENNTPTVILDYLFDNPDAPPLEPGPENLQGDASRSTALVRRLGDDAPENPRAKAPMEVHIGPITISNIGLQFTSGLLGVLLDVTVQLGPIELSILGLTLGVQLSGDFSLAKLPDSLKVTIDGVGVGFNKPPVVMAGLFEFRDPMYIGGIAVTIDPCVFKACGEYGVISTGTSSYKTVSVFADLVGPLIELEFAEVTTIVGGFGYNSNLTFPTAASVSQFPFFDSAVLGGDPLQTMENLSHSPWITPTNGDYWLAAGLTVNAFQAISMEAVVVIEFDPTVKMGFFADSIAQVPSEGDFKLMWVELLIAAVIDYAAGTMAIDGVLSPQSFIMDPQCHLSGGFALYYWFGSNQHAGDFVFTIGGYHPAYTPQPYYPNPARLSISWNMDDGSSINGNAYFAITPKACMFGGMLNYNMGNGPLTAFFDAWADLLINFKPFYYMGDVGLDVGVRFTLDLWIVTIHISVDIGAMLHIEGPPTHGYVHVDFWLFGFDIYFGPDPQPTLPITMEEFYKLLHQNPTTPKNDHVLNVETGMYTDPTVTTDTVPEGSAWEVHANTFSFSIGCVAAVSHVDVQGSPAPEKKYAVYALPMQLAYPLVSNLQVTVTEDADPTKTPLPFGFATIMKQVPMAVWGGPYNSNNDPSNQSLANPNQIGTLLDGTQDTLMTAVMGLTLVAPPATKSPDKLLFFNAIDRNRELLEPKPFPKTDNPAQENWLPNAPASKVSDQYAAVESKWLSPGLDSGAAQKAANLWADKFGWTESESNTPVPLPMRTGRASILKAAVAILDAAPPKNLIESLDQFYLAAPLLTKG